jgi:hypothetical protein
MSAIVSSADLLRGAFLDAQLSMIRIQQGVLFSKGGNDAGFFSWASFFLFACIVADVGFYFSN